MSELLYEYEGALYPSYLKTGNAMQFIEPVAKFFCRGRGLDIGGGKWPLAGTDSIDYLTGGNACRLPIGDWDYLFSSHCLEHLADPIEALEHWLARLRSGGVLVLYLPHPEMKYWQPQHCRKHLHTWSPAQMAKILYDLGFVSIIHSERDMAWSFCCVGFKP